MLCPLADRGTKLLWPEITKIWLGCWPPHIPSGLSPSTNTPLGLKVGELFFFFLSFKGEWLLDLLVCFFCVLVGLLLVWSGCNGLFGCLIASYFSFIFVS